MIASSISMTTPQRYFPERRLYCCDIDAQLARMNAIERALDDLGIDSPGGVSRLIVTAP